MTGYALDPNIIYKIRKLETMLGRKLSPDEIGQLSKGNLATQASQRLAGESAVSGEAVGEKKLELGGRELELLKKQIEQEKLTNTISGIGGLASMGLTGSMLGKELGLWGGGVNALPSLAGLPETAGALTTGATAAGTTAGTVAGATALTSMTAPAITAGTTLGATTGLTGTLAAGGTTAGMATSELVTAGAAMPQFVLPLAIGAGIALLFSKIFK